MQNPLKFVSGAVQAVAALGKGVGKAQKLIAALSEDKDGNGSPEYKDAFNGLVKIFNKAKDDSLPLLKSALQGAVEHAREYEKIIKEEVIPHIVAVFNAARQAALEE